MSAPQKTTDGWLKVWRALAGTGAGAWELLADDLHHWPLLIVALWALGAPLEELVALLTHGKIQISVPDEHDHSDDGNDPDGGA